MNKNNLKFTKDEAQRILLHDDKTPFGRKVFANEILDDFLTIFKSKEEDIKKSENNVQVGDFVRLTDPLDNGTIVRIENVDENGFASWLGGSQAADMKQVSVADGASPIGNDIDGYYFNLSEIITEIERRVNAQTWLNLKKPFKVYPESAVEYWKNRAEVEEKEHVYYEKAWNKEHNKLLDTQVEIVKLKEHIIKVCKESSDDIQKLDAENKKLKEELARCRAKNAAYLREKKQAENKAELLEKEVADLKVPESRQNRHLRDELHKVRLECQQAWESANKEMAENKELRQRILLLEAELMEVD